MNKIFIEERHKLTVLYHERLNVVMKEVVKTQVIKRLDASTVYPISDSRQASPVQHILKKGGMTQVTNYKDEFILIQTIIGWRIYMVIKSLIIPPAKIITQSLSQTRCWTNLLGRSIIEFGMDILAIIIYTQNHKIKRRPRSPVLMGRMFSSVCPLDCAMHQRYFSGV